MLMKVICASSMGRSRWSAADMARSTRHCCSVSPWARSAGRKRIITASRALSKAMGRERAKERRWSGAAVREGSVMA